MAAKGWKKNEVTGEWYDASAEAKPAAEPSAESAKSEDAAPEAEQPKEVRHEREQSLTRMPSKHRKFFKG